MTISGISSGSSYFNPMSGSSSTRQSSFQALQKLAQALQSGNLQGAQSAFSSLQTVLPSSLGGTGTGAASAVSPTAATTAAAASPLTSDLQNLSQALQSNNLSAAQSAFAQLQKDASQGSQQVMGHHHHHPGGGSYSSASATASGGATGVSTGAVSSAAPVARTTGTTGLSLTA